MPRTTVIISRTGFNTSPWRWFALNAQYQYQYSDSDYNYPIDVAHDISGSSAYPGFILNRKIKTDGFETKLDLRPANWIKTTLILQDRWHGLFLGYRSCF